jgi:hypothetical protein
MFDELERLAESAALRGLLSQYAELGTADREAWQDRLMQLEGVRPEELVKLHGELIAHGWVEQNTGITPVLQRGAVPRCYRVTTTGQRALKHAQSRQDSDTEYDSAAA